MAEDVVAELLGHTYGKTMSFGHYAKESSVQKLKNALEKLNYAWYGSATHDDAIQAKVQGI